MIWPGERFVLLHSSWKKESRYRKEEIRDKKTVSTLTLLRNERNRWVLTCILTQGSLFLLCSCPSVQRIIYFYKFQLFLLILYPMPGRIWDSFLNECFYVNLHSLLYLPYSYIPMYSAHSIFTSLEKLHMFKLLSHPMLERISGSSFITDTPYLIYLIPCSPVELTLSFYFSWKTPSI